MIEDLNLTAPVRDGILRHSSGAGEPATLEGKIVRLVDRIAYINHDIDDALRAGRDRARRPAGRARSRSSATPGSQRIDTLVHDLVEHSERAGDIVQGEAGRRRDAAAAHVHVRARLPRPDRARPSTRKIERVLRGLFDWYVEHPDELPEGVPGATEADRVIDYLAGMTDRFAHPRLAGPLRPAGPGDLMAALHRRLARARPRRGRLRRAGRRAHRAQAGGPAADDRACARSTTSARRRSASTRSRSSTTASAAGRAATSSSSRWRPRGSTSPVRWSRSPSGRGSSSSARRRTRARPSGAAGATGCSRCSSAPRRTTCACCGSRAEAAPARAYLGRARAAGGRAARVPRRVLPAARGTA